jgi:hypothetical protein
VRVRARVPQAALRQAKEPDVVDPQQRGSISLLGPPNPRNLAARNLRVESARIPVGQHAVRHHGALVDPSGDRAASPELRVIRMSDDHQHPIDVVIRHARQAAPSRSSTYRGHSEFAARPADTMPARVGLVPRPCNFRRVSHEDHRTLRAQSKYETGGAKAAIGTLRCRLKPSHGTAPHTPLRRSSPLWMLLLT